MLPYWSLYLKQQGFSPQQIGQLLALGMITKLAAPTFWGWLGDSSGRRMLIVQATCFAGALSFSGVPVAGHSFWGLALVMFAYHFFWNATLPQFEATTLSHLNALQREHDYSRIRLWGSLGFILSSIAFGGWLSDLTVLNLPYILIAFFVLIGINSLLIPESPQHKDPARQTSSIKAIICQPAVIALFIAAVLMMASHGPYYVFFSIYLDQLNYSGITIGLLWAVGVIAEIVVFWLMPGLFSRYSARQLLILTFALTCLRWLVTAYTAQYITLLLFAQLLHGFSYGMHHAVSIHLVYQWFGKNYQGRGQALYSSLCFGIGGIAGSVGAGYFWQNVGPTGTYLLAAGLSFIAGIVIWLKLR